MIFIDVQLKTTTKDWRKHQSSNHCVLVSFILFSIYAFDLMDMCYFHNNR